MGLMNDYYTGPSPYAAAVSGFTENFMKAYGLSKNISLEEQRNQEMQKRTAIEQATQQEQVRARQQAEDFQKQQLSMENERLNLTRVQTQAAQQGLQRGEKARGLVETYWNTPVSGGPNQLETGLPQDVRSQTENLDQIARILMTVDPDKALPYQEAAFRSRSIQQDQLKQVQAQKFQEQQMALIQQQAANEETKTSLMKGEEEGRRQFILSQADDIFKKTGIRLTEKTPLSVVKETMDIYKVKLTADNSPKFGMDMMKQVTGDIHSLEADQIKYMQMANDPMTPKTQKPVIASELERIKGELEKLRGIRTMLGLPSAPEPAPLPPMQGPPPPPPGWQNPPSNAAPVQRNPGSLMGIISNFEPQSPDMTFGY